MPGWRCSPVKAERRRHEKNAPARRLVLSWTLQACAAACAALAVFLHRQLTLTALHSSARAVQTFHTRVFATKIPHFPFAVAGPCRAAGLQRKTPHGAFAVVHNPVPCVQICSWRPAENAGMCKQMADQPCWARNHWVFSLKLMLLILYK